MARCLLVVACLAMLACSTTRSPEPGTMEAQTLLARLQSDIAAMEAQTGGEAARVLMHPDVWNRLRVLTHGRPVETVVGLPIMRTAAVQEWTIVMRQPGEN